MSASAATRNGKPPAEVTPAEVTPAEVTPAEVTPAEIDVAALTAAPAHRPPTYRVPDGAKRSAFGAQELSVGVNVKSGDACYVLANGTNMVGFPQPAVAVLIRDGHISRATIRALWAAADAAEAAGV